MIDGYLLLAPLLLVPIVFLIRLVGCSVIYSFERDEPPPGFEDGGLEAPGCSTVEEPRLRPVDFRIRFFPDAGLTLCSEYTVEVELARSDGSETRRIRAPQEAVAGITPCEVQVLPDDRGTRWYYNFFACFEPAEYEVTCRYWRSDSDGSTARSTDSRTETFAVDGRDVVLAQQPAPDGDLELQECFDWPE